MQSLQHYGMPRRSGRYPWGSGENPFQHMGDIYTRYNKLKKDGLSETEIAEEFNTTTTQLRKIYRLAKDEVKNEQRAQAKKLRDEGWSNEAIAKELGLPGESSVRSLLNVNSVERAKKAEVAAKFLKNAVDDKGPIILSPGVEREKGIETSREKLDEAVLILQKQGYEIYNRRIPQPTNPGKYTTVSVVCPPGTEYKDIYDIEKLSTLKDYTTKEILDNDGAIIRKPFEYPASMDSKRMEICYAEDGGELKDGLIEIRRGVPDLNLGEANYAQVRILVDGTHYLKGMAAYADDLPDGIDIRFNTNKTKGTPALGSDSKNTVLKKIKSDDPDNPFNSLIKENGGQSYYDDPNGKYTDPDTGRKQSLSLINKRADEGDWGEWSHNLPSQFLAKQSKELAKRQLDLAASDKELEFDEIKNLTNPTVKKQLLREFANNCDSSAVHLKAAALPRQQYQVIMPLTTLKDNEVYAPNYNEGEKVALIRYPHGGTFEIPILTVNNHNKEGERMIGKNPKDAVGITKAVADRLSGADFDGDTVMVIPTHGKNGVRITSTDPLKGLEGFDPKMEYAWHEGIKEMKNTQNEMGKVSNLITDMTIKGAQPDEIAKAVRHSMVVIDAEKHHLDYKQSEADNDIKLLKRKYMLHLKDDGKESTGASTIISRASAEDSVLKRRGDANINQKGKPWYDESKPEGALIFKTAKDSDLYYPDKKPIKKKDPETGKYLKDDKGKFVFETYIDINGKERVKYEETGKIKARTQKSTQMAETSDANTLVSAKRHPIELLYANYANKMKSLANEARKEMVYTDRLQYNKQAAKVYAPQVKSLNDKLVLAESNKQKEMQAVLLANKEIARKTEMEPGIKNDKKLYQKIQQQAMTRARAETGAKRNPIDISDAEWEAIQSGAISENKLTKILRYADTDKIRERATPRTFKEVSPAKQARIKAMAANDLTNAEIAKALGISSTTVSRYLSGKE